MKRMEDPGNFEIPTSVFIKHSALPLSYGSVGAGGWDRTIDQPYLIQGKVTLPTELPPLKC
jgi:hypothetical protein